MTWTLESPVKEKSLKDKLYTKIKHLIDEEVEEYTSDINLKVALKNDARTRSLTNEFRNLVLQWV